MTRLRGMMLAFVVVLARVHCQDGTGFFEAKVRPMLLERCAGCHGAEKQKGGLRLDHPAGIRRGGDRGPLGPTTNPGEGLLLRVIRYDDPELRMPPKGRLADAEIRILEEWMSHGAPMPEGDPSTTQSEFDLAARKAAHWCWQPCGSAVPPQVRDGSWPRVPADTFILAGLEAKGLSPAPEVEPRSWLRRVSYDLCGLPPTAAEVVAFERDSGEKMREGVVDRLLASPGFGERWGRHWLDLVRYAESRGHEFDYDIANAWQYRDYVVRALNDDLPFDAFVTEHVAGDLVAPPRRHRSTGAEESVLGTGFWLLGEELHSPVDLRADELDRLDNRLDAFSKAFLGVTVACARCHDHKFDAISQQDYYALEGFLLSSSSRQFRFETATAERAAAVALRDAREQHRSAVLAAVALRLEGVKSDSLRAAASSAPAAGAPSPEELRKMSGVKVIVDYGAEGGAPWLQDGWSFGMRPQWTGEAILGPDPGRPILGFATRGAAAVDPSWPALALAEGTERDPAKIGWAQPGRVLRTPTVVLGTGMVHHLVRGSGRVFACVASYRMIEGPLHGTVVKQFEEAAGWNWITHDLRAYAGLRVHFEFSPATDAEGKARPLEIAAVIEADETPPAMAELVTRNGAAGGDADPARLSSLLEQLAAGKDLPAVDLALLDRVFRAGAVSLNEPVTSEPGNDGAARWSTACAAAVASIPKASRTAPALLDGSGVDECTLARGNPKIPLAEAPRRFLEAIDGPSPLNAPKGSGRLELARRLVDRENPLVARVAVNRIWHHLFGRGLVPSVDDFGAMGERPTHPELLDAMAREFIDGGWSVKKVIRSLVLSSTYRMSSRENPAAAEVDPKNDARHRHPLRRIEAEAVRDAILAVSGRLSTTTGGPPVPVALTEEMQGRGRPGISGPLDGHGRRSLYLSVRRNFLNPFLLAFDFPAPFGCVGRRTVSNVPAQALALLNHPFVAAEARRTAGVLLALGVSDDAARLDELWLRAFARRPEKTEVQEALRFVGLGSGSTEEAESRRNAWTALVHAVFNAKEFIHVE